MIYYVVKYMDLDVIVLVLEILSFSSISVCALDECLKFTQCSIPKALMGKQQTILLAKNCFRFNIFTK